MEEYHLNEDIKVICSTAESFPNGILAAYQKLNAQFSLEQRRYFGISWANEKGEIIYKATVEEIKAGEAEKFGFETFIIKKGTFISELVPGFVKDVSLIRKTFEKLLNQSNIDPNGYCLEMYINESDVRLMVGIKK